MSEEKTVEQCKALAKLTALKEGLTQWQYLAIKNFLEYVDTSSPEVIYRTNRSLYYVAIMPLLSTEENAEIKMFVINTPLKDKNYINTLLSGTISTIESETVLSAIYDILTHALLLKTNNIELYYNLNHN